MTPPERPLVLAALRAHMGDWTYYISFLRMADVAKRVSIAEQIHSSKTLQELLQRQLTNRSRGIASYLLNQEQRFFNALVVATYGGTPEWTELAVDEGPAGLVQQPPEQLDGVLGFLRFDGSETLFAVDGQHRVEGIRQALKQNPDLGKEEVCILLVPGITQSNRSENEEGFQRTRRLFSTLNQYAKPVSKRDIIALDEDDVVAIITRQFVDEHPLFTGSKLSKSLTKAINENDRTSFTNLISLYDVLDLALQDQGSARGWADFKKLRPPESVLADYVQRALDYWQLLIGAFAELREYAESEPLDDLATTQRGPHGGHLLFRPIGLMMVARGIAALRRQIGLEEAVRRSALVPMQLSEEPWNRLLWNPTNTRMITTGENQRVALKIFVHCIGGDLSALNTTEERLIAEWAEIIGRPVAEVELPPRVA